MNFLIKSFFYSFQHLKYMYYKQITQSFMLGKNLKYRKTLIRHTLALRVRSVHTVCTYECKIMLSR